MSQNKRPVRPGGTPVGGSVNRPAARISTVQVRSVSGAAQPAQHPAAQVRPAAQPRPAAQARPAGVQPRPVMQARPATAQPRPAAQARPAAAQPRPAVQARPAQAAERPASSRLPYDFAKLLGIGLLIIAIGVAGHLVWPNGYSIHANGAVEAASAVSEIHGSGPIRINELMGSNDSTAVDENGASADWIEIANIGDRAINLKGYSLAKNERATNVFEFPDHTLEPGQCAVVYADSVLKQTAGETYHAPFRLSSQGGSLMLFNASGTAIDSVNFPAMTADMSYARQDQSLWSVSGMATPGMLNTTENYTALHQSRNDAGVEITEVVSSNTKIIADENGEYHDYFELHNTTGAAIDLSGWFVSDMVGRPTKWRLPDGFVLQAGEYRIVYASGLDRADAAHPHTNFGLSSEGEAVVLSDNAGRVADRVEYNLLAENAAWLKQADGSWASGTPTPGH